MIRSIRLRLFARGRAPSVRPSPRINPFRSCTCRARSFASGTQVEYIGSAGVGRKPAPGVPPDDGDYEAITEDEPYGEAYGAGPSRLPYDPVQKNRKKEGWGISRREAEIRARQEIKKLLGGVKKLEDHVETILDPSRTNVISQFNSLHCRSLVHSLVSWGHPLVAARLMLRYIEYNLSHPNPDRPLVAFRAQTVTYLFTVATAPSNREDSDVPGIRLVPRGTTEDIDILLPLLSALQRIRNQRVTKIYDYLIERLCAEGLYDTAAKVYVELAEEWITEGRLALGADPDSFYEGGGPPREGRAEWELRWGLYKTWWKGVRTWVLPGEVLSPHDRLDLWHPRKLKLPQRLRKFPMPVPTSPPNIVPNPTFNTLKIIADSLQLEPDVATLEAFERSMRACAILASPILSRTLPYLPVRLLRDVLDKSPMHPPVFPENYTGPKTGKDAWAYTAYTHVHLAIRSLLLSPPTRPALFEYMMAFDQARSRGEPLPPIPERYRYQTTPLSFQSCIFLIKYAWKKVQRVNAFQAVYLYVRDTWGASRMTPVLSMVLRSLPLLGAKGVPLQVDKVITTETAIAIDSPALSPARSPRKPSQFEIEAKEERLGGPWSTLHEFEGLNHLDEKSICSFLKYLTATSQHDRFVDTVYKLLPHLQHSVRIDARMMGDAKNPLENLSHPQPIPLTPKMYEGIMIGISNTGETALGLRVFKAAMEAENIWAEDFMGGEPIPHTHRMTVAFYTATVRMWYKYLRHAEKAQRETGVMPVHVAYRDKTSIPRDKLATKEIWRCYLRVRERWQPRESRFGTVQTLEQARRIEEKPSAALFDMLIAVRRPDWGFEGDLTTHTSDFVETRRRARGIEEMRMIARDIHFWGYRVPLFIDIRVGRQPPLSKIEVERIDAKERALTYRLVHTPGLSVDPHDIAVPGPTVEDELDSFPEEWKAPQRRDVTPGKRPKGMGGDGRERNFDGVSATDSSSRIAREEADDEGEEGAGKGRRLVHL